MIQSQPLVTIITPTYNRADFLPETIESVFNQTYTNIEYIVLDDGSTDETTRVLNGYAGRLRWESHPNQGEAATVNRGYGMAQGDLIGVVNSDDPILAELVEAVVAFMAEHPEVMVVYPCWQKIDKNSKPISAVYERPFSYEQMLRECICLIGPGAFIRREALMLVHGRNTKYRYVSDFDFWLRLGLRASFAQLPRLLATHRVHEGSATFSQRGIEMAQEHVELFEALFASLDLHTSLKALRSKSLSTIYYMAAGMCLPGSRAMARAYFVRSFRLAPHSYLRHPKRIVHLLSAFFLPMTAYDGLYRRWRRLSRVDN